MVDYASPMNIERTDQAQREFDEKVSNLPCHDRAAEFDGLCYLSMGHPGTHVYQPRLDLYLTKV